MQSGSPIPTGDIVNGQADYDGLVAATGCSSASDTLQCLRDVDYEMLKAASLRLTWLPRADGVFLTDGPQAPVQQGSIANVPFVTGNCGDEGTLFSLSNLNVTTDSDLSSYIKQIYIPAASDSDIDSVLQAYPADSSQGSPFDTGPLYNITAQYRRLASFQGDLIFQAPRRFFLNVTAAKQPTWSFLSKRLGYLPYIGSAHGTDLLNVYYEGEIPDFLDFGLKRGDMENYLVHFVNNLDPNGATGIHWPQYSLDSRELLVFENEAKFWDPALSITTDDYRVDALNVLTNLSLRFPM